MITTAKIETVQQGRHEIRHALSAGYKEVMEADIMPPMASDLDYELTGDRFDNAEPLGKILNATGRVFTILRGLQGLSKDEQVARLTKASDLIEQARSWALTDLPPGLAEHLDEAGIACHVTLALATDRDFEAHQAVKQEAIMVLLSADSFSQMFSPDAVEDAEVDDEE